MLTSQQIQQFRQADADLDSLTVQRVLDLLQVLSVTSPVDFTAGVMDVLPTVVAELGDVSATLAADAYEIAREQAGVSSRFAVDLSDPPGVEQVQTSARWALAPLFSAENALGVGDLTALLSQRLTAATPRLVREGGRLTTVDNSARDPAKPRYRRVTRSNGCDFCRMLSGRGNVYLSEDSAGVGRHFHDHCHCYVTLDF